MKRFIKPNWKNSNLNVSATLAEFLGAPNKNATLDILKNELQKGYKNVVFICFDGMGIYPLQKNLKPNDFLRKNIKQTLVSTFPSTTTNATTSLISNLLPLEHGWFGWSLYFDEIKQNIDVYLSKNTLTGEKVNFKYPIFDNSICYFDNTNTDYNITPIFPEYVQTHNKNKISIKTPDDLFKSIKQVCESAGKQFIYAYFPDPDATMHDYGVCSKEANVAINNYNKKVEELYNSLQDTLIIITADHGQIDVAGFVEFYKDKELNAMLECTPYLDARTPAFRVKKGKKKEFETKFKQKYGEDFRLYKSKDLIKKGYFGCIGDKGYLLGDFIAIGTYTHKQFISYENMNRFKGHHTSLTEEMQVPLILLAKKD